MLKGKSGIIFLAGCLFILTNAPTVLCMTSSSGVYVAGDGSGDYNCDGTDDHIQIQQALAYAASNPGTTVYLKGPFTYNVDPNKMYVGSHTTITGDSTAVVKIKKQDPNFPTPSLTRAIFQANGGSTHDITFHGFEIDGNILNSWSVSGNDHVNMIQLLGSSNVNVYDMSFKNGLGDAVKVRQGSNDNYVHENTNIQIYNNKIDKIGHDGIYLFCVSNISIHDNFISCRDDSGIRLFNCKDASIFNNEIISENHGGAGIEIQKNSAVKINNIEIYENNIHDIRTMGIWIYGYGTYDKTAATGVHIHHNIIRGNGLYTDEVGGIVLQGFDGTLIENNIIDGNYRSGVAMRNSYDYVSPGSGYVTTLRNNIITNTVPDTRAGGTAYGVSNDLSSTHSFVMEYNCVYNPGQSNYNKISSHTTDINVDPLFVDKKAYDYHLKSKAGHWSDSSWVPDTVSSPCIDAGSPSSDYSNEPEDNGNRINIGAFGNTKYASLSGIAPVTRSQTPITESQTPVTESQTPVTESQVSVSQNPSISKMYDNRLRDAYPEKVYSYKPYLDVGNIPGSGIYRDIMLFDLSEYTDAEEISSATFSLNWYYPDVSRPEDTVIEIYRPAASWNPEYVSWNKKDNGVAWNNAGGDWLDKTGEFQGSTPYATITIKGSAFPDNRYYELDVTDLVKEYVSGEYENTGFLIKTRYESSDYVAFHSFECGKEDLEPKLDIVNS